MQAAGRAGLRFLAWCLMGNHVHLVAVPEREESLARRLTPGKSGWPKGRKRKG